MTFNHYQVLGVRLAAGRSEIRAAYQRLAREYHPDRNPGDNSVVAVMQHVNEAYEVLSDEKKRHEYDFERGWRQTPPPSPTPTPSLTPARSPTPPPQAQPRRRPTAGPSAAPRGGPANFFGPQGQQQQQQQPAPRPSIPELDGRITRMRAEGWKAATAAEFLFRRVAWEESRNALLTRYLEIEPLLDSQSLTERQQLRNQLVRDKQAYENGEVEARDEKAAEALEILGPPTRQNLAVDEYFAERVKKWSRLGGIPAARMVVAPYKGQSSIETPWHHITEPARAMNGVFTCDRCTTVFASGQRAKCRECGGTFCERCAVGLRLLGEYESWLRGKSGRSFFDFPF